jgi:hypothetical protein
MPEEEPKSFEETTGRKEDSAVFNDAIEVSIGGVSYPLKKPPIRKAREWRSKLITLQQSLQAKAGNGSGDLEVFSYINDSHLPALSALVANYCDSSGLTVEILETQGTDEELIDAFMAIMRHCRIPLDRMKTAI